MNPSTSSIEYAQIWYESVLRNCRVNKTTLHIGKPGRHTLKILCGDAGTVLQKIVLDFGGMQRSYQGPPPTRAEEVHWEKKNDPKIRIVLFSRRRETSLRTSGNGVPGVVTAGS